MDPRRRRWRLNNHRRRCIYTMPGGIGAIYPSAVIIITITISALIPVPVPSFVSVPVGVAGTFKIFSKGRQSRKPADQGS